MGAAAAAATGKGGASRCATMLPFVDWTTRVPAVELPPFEGVDSVMLMTPPVDWADLASAPRVEGLVQAVDRATFAALKVATKRRETTLNAPLMIAFFAAVRDCALKQNPELQKKGASPTNGVTSEALSVRSVCVVDLRRYLDPPLPEGFMNNSVSIVPAFATFE